MYVNVLVQVCKLLNNLLTGRGSHGCTQTLTIAKKIQDEQHLSFLTDVSP